MNDTFEDTGAVELTVLDDDALDNVTGGLLNRSFVAVANGGIPIGTPIALLFIAAALIFFRLFLSRHRSPEAYWCERNRDSSVSVVVYAHYRAKWFPDPKGPPPRLVVFPEFLRDFRALSAGMVNGVFEFDRCGGAATD